MIVLGTISIKVAITYTKLQAHPKKADVLNAFALPRKLTHRSIWRKRFAFDFNWTCPEEVTIAKVMPLPAYCSTCPQALVGYALMVGIRISLSQLNGFQIVFRRGEVLQQSG
jgi:hypothetical protein